MTGKRNRPHHPLVVCSNHTGPTSLSFHVFQHGTLPRGCGLGTPGRGIVRGCVAEGTRTHPLVVGRMGMTRWSTPRYTSDMTSTPRPRITIEPGKCGGKPCIRGMRIRVSDVLELLANGASIEEILTDYPCLERDDILAAIAYAAQQTNHVVVEVA
jgi:uncharacterized protein (DUF433 family)